MAVLRAMRGYSGGWNVSSPRVSRRQLCAAACQAFSSGARTLKVLAVHRTRSTAAARTATLPNSCCCSSNSRLAFTNSHRMLLRRAHAAARAARPCVTAAVPRAAANTARGFAGYADDVSELIGATPMVKLNRVAPEGGAERRGQATGRGDAAVRVEGSGRAANPSEKIEWSSTRGGRGVPRRGSSARAKRRRPSEKCLKIVVCVEPVRQNLAGVAGLRGLTLLGAQRSGSSCRWRGALFSSVTPQAPRSSSNSKCRIRAAPSRTASRNP